MKRKVVLEELVFATTTYMSATSHDKELDGHIVSPLRATLRAYDHTMEAKIVFIFSKSLDS